MKRIVNIVFALFIVLLAYLVKSSNMLLLTISFNLGIIVYSLLDSISINKISNNNKYKTFKFSFFFIIVGGIILSILNYFIGNLIGLDKLGLVNTFMTIFITCNILIKLLSKFLELINYRKLSNNLVDIYRLSYLILSVILSILLYKVFNFASYINIIILYSTGIFTFLVIAIILYFYIFRKLKKEKNNINYLTLLKKITIKNKKETIYNLVKYGYIYVSVLILYYILLNKYNYSYDSLATIISNTYFYGIIFIYYIYRTIKKYLKYNYDDFNSTITKVIKHSFSLTILLMVISGPVSRILFNQDNFLFDLVFLLPFYLLYDLVIDFNLKLSNTKINNIVIFSGFIVKIIFEVPLINAIYRMGYNLPFGGVLANILGMIFSIGIGIIFISKKLKLNLLDNFNNILNIIYENIIYCLILVLLTMIVKVETKTIFGSILVIIFYIMITILLNYLRKKTSHK